MCIFSFFVSLNIQHILNIFRKNLHSNNECYRNNLKYNFNKPRILLVYPLVYLLETLMIRFENILIIIFIIEVIQIFEIL
jgi:hypothetical protein